MHDREGNTSFYFQLFANSGLFVKMFLVIAVMAVCLLILSTLGLVLAIPLFGVSFSQINVVLSGNLKDTDISLLKYIQLIQSVSLFIIPAIILNHILFQSDNKFFTSRKFPSITLIILVLITLIVSSPLIEILLKWNSSIKFPSFMAGIELKLQESENKAAFLTEKLLSGQRITDYLINILMVAIIPAIGEEFLFRGILQRLFAAGLKNIHLSVLFAAILFSGFHFQFYGFFPRLALGLFFGYLFYWSGSIWIAVLAHFFNNFFEITIEFLDKNYGTNLSAPIEKFQSNQLEILISLALTIFLVSQIRKRFSIIPETRGNMQE
jgi:membrane protease YdiL (CAAX protease family)